MGYVRALIVAAGMCLFAVLGDPSARAQTLDPVVEALLTHTSHKVRIKAAKKLARVKGKPARDALLAAAADDENPLVRAAAANSLESHPSGDSVSTLCALLGDRDDFVRRTASRALKGFGGTGGCPAWLRLEVTGDSPEMRTRVRETLDRLFADEPTISMTEKMPKTVEDGVLRGYELKLRLEREVTRGPESIELRCRITQSIFDLPKHSLRGSATQKGSLTLGATAPEPVVTMQIAACMDALAPVVHRGMTDFLARSRR